MFFWNTKKIAKLNERVAFLEQQNIALSMTLQNLQAALLAMSKTQDSIAKDVGDMNAIVSTFLAQIQEATAWHNFDPGDGYEH